MTEHHTRPRTSRLTPILAGAALVLAGYLILERHGAFDPGPVLEPRPVQPRGTLASAEETTIKIFEENAPSAVHILVAIADDNPAGVSCTPMSASI